MAKPKAKVNLQKNFLGTYTNPNGEEYTGYWVADKKNGEGKNKM